MQEVFLTDDHLCLVMDLADGGDLSSTIDRLRLQGVRTAACVCRHLSRSLMCQWDVVLMCDPGCSAKQLRP